MKKLTCSFTVFYLLLFSKLFAQTILWNRTISPTPQATIIPEIKDIAIGPDKKIYSTGYFLGTKATFGSLTLFADTSFDLAAPSGIDKSKVCTGFISAQDSSGNFIWATAFQSDWSFSPQPSLGYIGNHHGQKITVDPAGNVYVGFIATADTLKIGNSSFDFGVPPNQASTICIGLVKFNSAGQIGWCKLMKNGSGFAIPSFEALSYRRNKLDVLVTNAGLNETTTGSPEIFPGSGFDYKQGRLTINANNGSILRKAENIFSESGVLLTILSFAQFLEDGRLSISLGNPTAIEKTNVYLLDTNMSPIHTISFRLEATTGSFTPRLIPSFIKVNPNGSYILLFYLGPLNTGTEKLFVNNDTIAPTWFQPMLNNKMLLVRMSLFNCVKLVKPLKNRFDGEVIELGDNGFLAVGDYDGGSVGLGGVMPANLLRYNRNGSLISSNTLGFPNNGYSVIANANSIIGSPKNTFHFRPHDGKVILGAGNKLFKIAVPNQFTTDSSSTICLRSSASPTAVSFISGEADKAFEIFPNPAIDFTKLKLKTWPNEGVNLSISDLLGKTWLSTTLQTEEALDVRQLPKGIYLMHFVVEGKASKLRFIKE